jgi:hypothetical protein
MAFLLILQKHFMYLFGKLRFYVGQTLTDILMYRTFGNSELSGCGTDGCTMLNNVGAKLDGSVIRLTVHNLTPISDSPSPPSEKPAAMGLSLGSTAQRGKSGAI